MRLDLFCKQMSHTVILFDRKESECRGKNSVSVRNYNIPYEYQILVLFIVFEVLLYICMLNWILHSSSYLKYLATTL